MKRIILVMIITFLMSISKVYAADKPANKINLLNNKKTHITESYYGKWSVKKVIGYAKVSALDSEEAGSYIGRKLLCKKKKVQFNASICNKPWYKISRISNKEFFKKGYVTLKNIGINNESITKVVIYSKNIDDYKYYWNNFGGTFYIKNKNILIVDFDGVYFELIRVK